MDRASRLALGDRASATQAARSAALLLERAGHHALPAVFVPYLDLPSPRGT